MIQIRFGFTILLALSVNGLIGQDTTKSDYATLPANFKELILEYGSQLDIKSFYTVDAEMAYEYGVLGKNTSVESFKVTSAESPFFEIAHRRVDANISEKDGNISFYLPTELGSDILNFLPAFVSFSRIQGMIIQQNKPEVEFTGNDTTCLNAVFSPEHTTFPNENYRLCLYQTHEMDPLTMFDDGKIICYRNKTVLEVNNSIYKLTHWFEPTTYGFVKFVFEKPDGKEWVIELVDIH